MTIDPHHRRAPGLRTASGARTRFGARTAPGARTRFGARIAPGARTTLGVLGVLGLAACWSSAAPPPSPAPATAGSTAAPPAPPPVSEAALAAARQRAQTLFAAQFAAALAGDREALVATFSPSAILLAHSDHPARDSVTDEWLTLTPSMQITANSAATFAARGDERAVWLVAEITLDEVGWTNQVSKTVLRISELATAKAGWKVIAAAVGETGSPDGYPSGATMPGKTAPGPLAGLVGHPEALLAALGDDTIVLGPRATDVVGVGAPARAALTAAPLAAISGEVREVRTGDLGFLQAHLADGTSLFLVATFRGAAAHVVLVHVLST
ncbi:MAG TPA: hypothetical protein VH165_17715 [Kofleriaceae bacterium]|nr:hypothetical protein [Kofleriaceae bacterium]